MDTPEDAEVNEQTAEELKNFLEDTKLKFDRYFAHLGYICFVFNKEENRGESVYVTNSPLSIDAIVGPYANANNIVERQAVKKKLKQLRRIK